MTQHTITHAFDDATHARMIANEHDAMFDVFNVENAIVRCTTFNDERTFDIIARVDIDRIRIRTRDALRNTYVVDDATLYYDERDIDAQCTRFHAMIALIACNDDD